jgi:UPF0755 protein
MTTLLRALAVLFLLLLLGGGGAALYGWQQTQSFLADRPAAQGEDLIVTIPRGSGPQAIARLLHEQGVVTDADRFYWFLRYREAAPKLRAGEFRFRTDHTPEQVLTVLLEAKEVQRNVTVPPGLRYTEAATKVEAAGLGPASEYVRLAEDAEFIASLQLPLQQAPKNLEGLLIAETYSFPRGSGVEDLVRAQAKRFVAIWNDDRRAKAKARGMSIYEVMTLASVVEKETGQAAERPLIAGVFHNRLRIGMPLQSDPTIIYGLVDYDGNIRRSDIRKPHPWNTYVIPALPPTPIAAPGVEAIDAVLEPDETKALYFVARGDGTHHFSSTLSEHNRMVDCYQRGRKHRCP